MERIFWVKNGGLDTVNRFLQRGGKVKSIHPISENITAYGYAGGETYANEHGNYVSDIYAYIVVEFDEDNPMQGMI